MLNETAPNQRTVWTWSKTVLMALIVIGGIVTVGIVLSNLARWGYRRWRA